MERSEIFGTSANAGGDDVAGHRWQMGEEPRDPAPGRGRGGYPITNGERVEVEARDGEIVIRRSASHLALEGLFHGKTPEQWRATYADAFDWGADVGGEVVKE